MRWGALKDADRKLFEQMDDRGETPKMMQEQPVLISEALPYWQAFNELSGQRFFGGFGGASEIRREAVTDWLDENGVADPVERQSYREMLATLDAEYLKLTAPKDPEKPKE